MLYKNNYIFAKIKIRGVYQYDMSSHTLCFFASFGELGGTIIKNHANTCLHYLCIYVLHQQLGFFMASNHVIKRRLR